MSISRNKLYILLSIACIAGYIWLYTVTSIKTSSINVCIIKNITTIACPSCGTTRAVIDVFRGNIVNSVIINPMGLIVAFIMILSPILMLYDVIFRKSILYNCYCFTENYVKRKPIAIILILLVLLNWIWNITKQL